MSSNFGKKETIFHEAIKLISSKGFDAVNLRNLAELSGIKAASIYNHYASKQEILDAIYAYYEKHFLDNYKDELEIKKIIEQGTIEEIINAFTFTFDCDDSIKQMRMVLITKIIYARFYTDERAADIFYNLMLKDREEKTKELLDYGISIGRFKSFDTKTFSFLLCGSMHMLGIKEFCREDFMVRMFDEEKQMKEMFVTLLSVKGEI